MIEQIGGIANSIAAVVVVLGLCIYAHELGHFVAAKLSGMHVREFAFGLGPVLAGFKWGETRYTLRAIPFGGLNDIAGMEPGQRNVERGFYTRPRWMQTATIVAGVFMNVVLALVLFWAIAVFHGIPVPDSDVTFISRTLPNKPARAADLQAGDQIVAVDGNVHSLQIAAVHSGSLADQAGFTKDHWILKVGDRDISVPTELAAALRAAGGPSVPVAVVNSQATSISEAIQILHLPSLPAKEGQIPGAAEKIAGEELGLTFEPLDQNTIVRYISTHPEKAIELTLLRNGQQIVRTVRSEATWERLETITAEGKLEAPHRQVGRIGVILSPEVRPTGIVEGFAYGAVQSVGAVIMVIDTVHAMVRRTVAVEPAGPVGIIAMTAAQAQAGWAAVLSWGGVISANLAVINLLPMPPFDGFHLILIGYEGILRRRVGRRQETIVRLAGIMVIMLLFAWLVAKDVTNLIQYGTP